MYIAQTNVFLKSKREKRERLSLDIRESALELPPLDTKIGGGGTVASPWLWACCQQLAVASDISEPIL